MNIRDAINTFRKHLSEPLVSIKENPYEFIVWWTAANIFGLAGFWLPMLICSVQGLDTHSAFLELINSGTLSAFSVVLLIEGLAAIWVVRETGTNFTAVGIRGFVSILALIVAVIQVSLLTSQGMMAAQGKPLDASAPSSYFQIVMTALTIAFASYLFCFRYGKWEKGVEEFPKEDNKSMEDLIRAIRQKTGSNKFKL
jgi:hypothetical protein